MTKIEEMQLNNYVEIRINRFEDQISTMSGRLILEHVYNMFGVNLNISPKSKKQIVRESRKLALEYYNAEALQLLSNYKDLEELSMESMEELPTFKHNDVVYVKEEFTKGTNSSLYGIGGRVVSVGSDVCRVSFITDEMHDGTPISVRSVLLPFNELQKNNPTLNESIDSKAIVSEGMEDNDTSHHFQYTSRKHLKRIVKLYTQRELKCNVFTSTKKLIKRATDCFMDAGFEGKITLERI